MKTRLISVNKWTSFKKQQKKLANKKNDTREIVVDLVHLENNVVRHTGFSQQHVQLARHAPGDRVDAKPAQRTKVYIAPIDRRSWTCTLQETTEKSLRPCLMY